MQNFCHSCTTLFRQNMILTTQVRLYFMHQLCKELVKCENVLYICNIKLLQSDRQANPIYHAAILCSVQTKNRQDFSIQSIQARHQLKHVSMRFISVRL